MATGADRINQLRSAGATPDVIDQWRQGRIEMLSNAGADSETIKNYFGKRTPNFKPVEDLFSLTKGEISEASDILGAIEAGWQISTAGLLARGRAPDIVLPEETSMAQSIASQTTTLIGDLPAMILGAAGGTAVLPGFGTAAGAFAAPTAIREVLMEMYDDDDIESFEEFWASASHIFMQTSKSAVLGAFTAGAGKIIKPLVKSLPLAARTTAQLGTEVGTLVTVGAALEGEMPSKDSFIEAAILIGGLRVSGAVAPKAVRAVAEISKETKAIAKKLIEIYKQTGIKPEEVVNDMQGDSYIHSEMLAKNRVIPTKYKEKIQDTVLPSKKPALIDLNLKMPERLVSSDVADIISNQRGEMKIPPFRTIPTLEQPKPPAKTLGPTVPETAMDKVLSRVAKGNRLKKGLTFDDVYENSLDDLHPIRVVRDFLSGSEPLKSLEDPYILARLTRGNFGRADQMLNNSTYNFKTFKNNGKSLRNILEPVQKDLTNFTGFLISKRAVELDAKGIKTGIDIEQAKIVVKQNEAAMSKTAKELVDYQNRVLGYMKDSGLISNDLFITMIEGHKSYIPFHRLLRDDVPPAKLDKGVKSLIKQIKGSEREVLNPLESIIKNTYAYITMAEKNRVVNSLIDLAESKGAFGEKFIKKIPAKMRPIEVSSSEIKKFFKDVGLDDVLKSLGVKSEPEGFNIFRPQTSGINKNEIVRFKNGKREVYEVHPSVARAVVALDPPTMKLAMKILAFPAKGLRAGTTINPAFGFKNVFRDQFQTFIVTKTGEFIPIYDAFKGLATLIGKTTEVESWLKGGGANAVMQSMDRNYISQNVFKLAKETDLLSSAINVVKSPIEMLSIASELAENATRMGLYKRISKGSLDPNDILTGAFKSRDILDFARTGAKLRGVDSLVAFSRSHFQGMDKMARAFIDNPKEASLKAVATVTIPSVLLWYANKDDPRYNDLPDWQKDLYWIVITDDTIYRIPKPFEPGIIFGSAVERLLTGLFKNDPDSFKNFLSTMEKAFIPSIMPTFATPIVEHIANKSQFTGAPILPKRLEGVSADLQYSDYTSESAKILGNIIGKGVGRESAFRSPIILENFIRAWSGAMGTYALQIADQLLIKSGAIPDPVKPASTLADLPFIRSFVIRDPSASTQPIIDFYEKFAEFQIVQNNIALLAGEGNFEGLQKELTLKENKGKLIRLAGINRGMNNMRKAIRLIHKIKDMTPAEKRAQIDHLYRGLHSTAKAGNLLVDGLQKEIESREGE